MCLAIPGKIVSKKNEQSIVDFDGVRKEINTLLVKAKKGDWVLVHAGFAIQKLSQKDAREVLKLKSLD